MLYFIALFIDLKCVLAWRGSEHDWLELNNLLNRELRNMPSSSSSSSSGDEAAHFEQHYEYSPPAGGTSRRPAAYGRADRAGGHPSDMPSSRYGSERRRSIAESRSPPPPYAEHPGPRNVGGNRDDGRTTRAQGGRVAGNFRYGQGSLRRQEGPNARDSSESSDDYFPDDAGNSRSNTRDRDPLRGHNVTAQGPADPWESDSSMILDATHPRAQAGMHSTSSRHNATNRRANSAEREVIMNRSERTGLPYGERSTHIW